LSSFERQLVLAALDSNWIAPVGPQVDAFERELGATLGTAHVAALNSGTAALHLALRIAGVGPGDEVLVSTLTFVASASPVVYLGAKPVFIDSEPRSWNLDPDLVVDAIEARAARGRLPRAVVAVHLFGQCADLNPILEVCAHYDIPVIEDAAEALLATYQGRAAGTMGQFGVFSFNGNKVITTSGGGALASARADLIARARFLAAQAREDEPHYQHSELGYNYRMSNIPLHWGAVTARAAAAGDGAAAQRARLPAALADLPGLRLQQEAAWVSTRAGSQSSLLIRTPVSTAQSCRTRSQKTSRAVQSGSRCTCSPFSPDVIS
jgi:pyridoxal phosphate-dependent aminotransferase EpsN